MTDDPVQPGPQGAVSVVLRPTLERTGEAIVRRVDRGLLVAEDGEGDPVLAVRLIDRLAAQLQVGHIIYTRQYAVSLQRSRLLAAVVRCPNDGIDRVWSMGIIRP